MPTERSGRAKGFDGESALEERTRAVPVSPEIMNAEEREGTLPGKAGFEAY